MGDAAARAIGEVRAGFPCAEAIKWKTNPAKSLSVYAHKAMLELEIISGGGDLPMRTDCCIFCSFA